jgi:hypothetical protein
MFRRLLFVWLALLPALLGVACQPALPETLVSGGGYHSDDNTGQDTDVAQLDVLQQEGGYTSKVSVLPGESLDFHISNNRSVAYTLNIYREGATRQLMATVPNVRSQGHACTNKASTGCDWPVATTFTVPNDWPSGVYTVDIPRESGRYKMIFFVRPRNPGAARILFLASVNTFQAYNEFGGGSLYSFNFPQLDKVSFDRPYLPGGGVGFYERWDGHFVEWAEAAGYEMDYAATYDLEFQPNLLQPYDVVVIAGHSEYWTWNMRQRLKAYISGGGRFMNLSGNTMWWQVRFEDNGRTMVGYKSWLQDPDKTRQGSTTVNWNYPILDPSFVITGLHWPYGGYPGGNGSGFHVVNAGHWIYDGTGLQEDDLFGKGPTRVTSIHDKESDGLAFNCATDGATILGPITATGTPRNFTILGVTGVFSKKRDMNGLAMMGLYTTPAQGAVFSAGTTGWALGLDQPEVSRITRNVLDRFLSGNFPQEPAAPDADVLFRDRFNCIAVERDRQEVHLAPADRPKLNYVDVVRGGSDKLTSECGYQGAGLSLKPEQGARYVALLTPDWSPVDSVYTRVQVNLHNLTLADNATIDFFHGYADDGLLDMPLPVAVLQLGRRAGQVVVRYQPVGQNFSWIPVPTDGFFLLETTWNHQARTVSLSINGQRRSLESLPASAVALNRVDFGTIAISGSASGTICVDELVYDDHGDDTPPPPPPSEAVDLSFATNPVLGGVTYADEDILHFNPDSQSWSLLFDGSDVGLAEVDVDAFARLPDGSLLLSVDQAVDQLPGVGPIADADVVQFRPSSMGANTSGQFSLYLDGSDVGLESAGEDIDALAVLPDGRLLLSTLGSFKVGNPPIKGASQDLLALTLTQPGPDSAGQFTVYFDGSDVGLKGTTENLDGVWAGDGALTFSTTGAAVVANLNFGPADLARCAGTTGNATSCTFSLRWSAVAAGLTSGNVDGVEVVP